VLNKYFIFYPPIGDSCTFFSNKLISVPSTPQHDTALFNRLLEKGLSPADTEALMDWLGSETPDPAAAELILKQLQQPVAQQAINPALLAALDAKLPAILSQPRVHTIQKPPLVKRAWVRYAAACILLLSGAAAAWFFTKPAQQQLTVHRIPVKNDVGPGMAGAVLTLDDGSTVLLDSLGNGVVATQNGSKLVLKNGQLVYDGAQHAAGEIAYNTMTTPKGRQFKLVLPDGTNVWLNAASSLRYPVAFTGKERKVEVKGEAYFEVAKLADPVTGVRMPFRVKVNNHTEIEVLGTHFNINAYEDEANMNTTLLEGAVRVINGGEQALLKPGQQARVPGGPQAGKTNIEIVENADVEKVMAWKNGVFNFNDASLAEVMRQLERWYNIEVVYEQGVPKLEFIGKMGRDLPLSDVLRGLEMSKVHFRLEEGRRVIVLP
jgi:ferric-dicitrate binding protein FerR (iron transport regulator)